MNRYKFIKEMDNLIVENTIDENEALHLIKSFNSNIESPRTLFEMVMMKIFLKTSVCPSLLKSKTRKRNVADARIIFYRITYDLRVYTLSFIGNALNRGHATVLHGYNRSQSLIEFDKDFRNLYLSVLEEVNQEIQKTA